MKPEEVKDLIKHLSGKVIVTADHGEALGEKRDLVTERWQFLG